MLTRFFVMNGLSADREFYITKLTAIRDRASDTGELEREKRLLDQQLAVDAKVVNDPIGENVRKAQNQAEYREREAALVNRYEETEAKRDAVAGQISQRVVRRRKPSCSSKPPPGCRNFTRSSTLPSGWRWWTA